MKRSWPAVMVLAGLSLLMCNCATKVSVLTMQEIQDKDGVLTKSLYYAGSNSGWHYFDQEIHQLDPRFFENRRLFRYMIPGDQNEDWQSYRVPSAEVAVPDDIEFPRNTYSGGDDVRHLKVRIKNDGESGYRVERRPTTQERNRDRSRKNKESEELKRPKWAEPREGRSRYQIEL